MQHDEKRRNDEDPRQEGHTTEWQDRARVMLNAKEAVKETASPQQSPLPREDTAGKEDNDDKDENKKERQTPY